MTDEKVNGLVLKEFYNKTYEELEKDFQSLIDSYQKRTYGLELSQEEYDFVVNEVAGSIKWKGTEVYAAEALRDVIIKLYPKKLTLLKRESLRALFHFLNNYESKGIEFVDVQKKILENVSLVMKEINEVEAELRDAATEMEAKRQGVDPEDIRRNPEEAQAHAAQVKEDAPEAEAEAGDTPKIS